jgi:hypothetical protein
LNEQILQEIPRLAGLYNAYANALDPESREQAAAAIAFTTELANLYDLCDTVPKPSPQDFRRAIIRLCKDFLRSERKREPPL